MAGARAYHVSLPVRVTVEDDGTVTYDVDTSEAGVEVRDEYYGDADTAADVARIEADHTRRNA